jgi:putative two-component system response regulator
MRVTDPQAPGEDHAERAHAYAFDGVVFEVASARLRVDGVEVVASALPLKLLEALCRQPGLLLTRHQLFDLIWPRQVSSDEALTKLIFRLRELLGPHAVRVVTVRGRGVRLDATVRRLAAPASMPHAAALSGVGESETAAPTSIDVTLPVRSGPSQDGAATVLIVDDTPENIALLSALLQARYRTRIATSGSSALKAVVCVPMPDLILLDVMMPEMDGYETCRRIKALPDCAEIPVIFLTARAGDRDEEEGFALGAVDYITKPVSPPLVLARVATHVELQRTRRRLQEANRGLERLISQRSGELASVRDGLLFAMANLATEAQAGARRERPRRLRHYVVLLAQALRLHPRFRHEFGDESIELLGKSVPLHDLGKLGVPRAVLDKATELDESEQAQLRRHPVHGRDLIRAVELQLGESSDFLRFAREIAHSYQECWDGSGYPEGLQGEEIPASARLMAVAESYDALRCAGGGLARAESEIAAMMEAERARRFDPDVLDAYLRQQVAFGQIAALFPDDDGPAA